MRIQKQSIATLLALAIGFVLAGVGCSDGEKEITLKFADCPVIVQKTIIANAGGVQFSDVDKETKKDGQVVYEAEGQSADGKKIEIKVASDGTLISVEHKDD